MPGWLAYLLAGVVIALPLALMAKPLGQWLGVMDMPPANGSHKTHRDPTPAVGGVILVVVGLLASVLPIALGTDLSGFEQRFLWLALVSCFTVMAIGFLDDRAELSARTRLLSGITGGTILLVGWPDLVVQRLSFPSIAVSLTLDWLAFPFTLLCLVGLKHAINMIDGRNGLLTGLSIIWSVFILFRMNGHAALFVALVLGAMLVLFAFNIAGKLFLGNCGSYGLAVYFGLLALMIHNDGGGRLRSGEIMLLFLVPVLDTLRLMVTRWLSSRSPFTADTNHLHHLLERSIGWRNGWVVYMLLVALPLLLHGQASHFHAIQIAVAACLYAVVVWWCTVKDR